MKREIFSALEIPAVGFKSVIKRIGETICFPDSREVRSMKGESFERSRRLLNAMAVYGD